MADELAFQHYTLSLYIRLQFTRDN